MMGFPGDWLFHCAGLQLRKSPSLWILFSNHWSQKHCRLPRKGHHRLPRKGHHRLPRKGHHRPPREGHHRLPHKGHLHPSCKGTVLMHRIVQFLNRVRPSNKWPVHQRVYFSYCTNCHIRSLFINGHRLASNHLSCSWMGCRSTTLPLAKWRA